MKVIYLTPKELAERFKISERQVTHLARSGVLPGVKIGKLWRFKEEDIETWEENQGIPREEVDSLMKEITGRI